jgi:hypothetical protein
MDEYEIINGKKYKKCKEGQIRNPKTLRCIKDKLLSGKKESVKKESGKKESSKKSSGRNKAAKIIQKFMKKNMYPFVNRVSSDIYSRIYYYKQIIKRLNIKKDKINKYCIIQDKDKPDTYYIDNIILKKHIGSKSANSIVFLSSFNTTEDKIYKYASKLYINNKNSKLEIFILQKLSNAVIKNECPHFPIMYGNVFCNKYELSLKLPQMINKKMKPYGLLFTELANGDLNKIMYNDVEYSQNTYMNAIVQCIMSLFFFYKYTGSFHNDAHGGNFLYHNIKKGGYFHYKIFNIDYYLENIGYLWIIWDYEFAQNINHIINVYKNTGIDILRVLDVFIPEAQGGFIKNNYYINSNNNNIITSLKRDIIHVNYALMYGNLKHITSKVKLTIQFILKYFVDNKLLLTSLPPSAIIINSNNPYIIDDINDT